MCYFGFDAECNLVTLSKRYKVCLKNAVEKIEMDKIADNGDNQVQ